jgi:hypothetical protein
MTQQFLEREREIEGKMRYLKRRKREGIVFEAKRLRESFKGKIIRLFCSDPNN